jgi:hypothetical protein
MHRSASLILILFLIPAAALSQTAPTDSQTLRALLAEIRQLRHDLQTNNANGCEGTGRSLPTPAPG